MSLLKIFLTEGLKVARVGVGAAAASQGAGTKRRRKKGAADCTPCAAMDMADQVRERISEGRIL